MTTVAQWVEGARPRTLPAAFSPVIAGTGIAFAVGGFDPLAAALALVVSVALQIGVNYANDYSDGVRGTDDERVGPMRLVGSGAARPATVKAAAFGCFGVAALAGLALVVLTAMWWLLAVGALSILAAWFYTGGKNPYGYLGLGELFVFVFFGLVAVCGTTLVQAGFVPWSAVAAAVAIGALACAILVANNLRDLAGDTAVGKRTLATRLGDRGTRWCYVGLCVAAAVAVVVVAWLVSWWCLLGLLFVVAAALTCRIVLSGAGGADLIRVLKVIGIAELLCAVGLAAGCLVAG
ncbi:1,4-dihydroxy-2-naphthoate polyprenyltransferase [Microlunatus sp. Y2014]|uniref:1,4-dihydroxy-2-naphthoate polyprenyltransferase n=1 Tax=Microlunatus sp. Y2014 TaxID=3418488 RepID=UPI003DA6D20B